jgi:hypothetical protein
MKALFNVLLSITCVLLFSLLFVLILKIYSVQKETSLSVPEIVTPTTTTSIQFHNIQNGLLIMSDAANSAGTYVWVVGGQAPGVLLGGSGGGSTGKQISIGTLTYTPTIKGYTWTLPAGFPLPFINMKYTILSL